MRELILNGRRINDAEPCYVIAELGHNHGGDLETARRLIKTAQFCGADAVKLQKRDNRSLYAPSILNAPYVNENSYGPTYGAHREALEFGHREYRTCQLIAREAGITLFATAFDEPSVDFLCELDVPAIKIASGGCTDHALLRYAARSGRPLIVSTGGTTFDDVDETVNLLTGLPAPFALLHCTAAYPVRDPAELNLLAIHFMRLRYPEIVIGWSGHDPGIAMALVAYAYGARIIEKHFTLNRASKGTDHAFSLEPKGLATLCEDLAKARVASGDGEKRFYPSEKGPIAKMRRVPTTQGWQITGELR